MSAIAQYRNQTTTLPSGAVEETTDPSTLVVGVWEPGRGNTDTLALDPLTYGNKSYNLAKKIPGLGQLLLEILCKSPIEQLDRESTNGSRFRECALCPIAWVQNLA